MMTFDRRHWVGKTWPWFSKAIDWLQWNARYQAWLKEHNLDFDGAFETRSALYELVCPKGPITYLEFGVFKGDSLKTWARLNTHPDSTFHGFDSFEGLPAAEPPWTKSDFAVDGVPVFGDQRINLYIGWFNDTLLPFLEEPLSDAPLVIHLDADLYSSTAYVLSTLDPLLHPGTILIFDELCVAQHEFHAMIDWTEAFGRSYTVVGSFKRGQRIEGVALRLL